MMIGLVPNDSLFVYLFGLILLLSTSNLITGTVSAIGFSWIAALLDPVTAPIGQYFLTIDFLSSTFANLAQMPLVPWTRFENTVVTGSVILGLMLLLPTYAISKRLFERYNESVSVMFSNSLVGRWLLGTPTQNVEQA